jgi:hypothetical protein
MAVQHNKWSQFEHEGHLYRVRLIDSGWSFANFQIQKQISTRRKYWVFGELIPTWKHLVSPEYNYFVVEVFLRRNFYESDWIKGLAVRAVESHQDKIELRHENKI